MELDMFHSQEFFAAYIKLHALLLLFVLLSYIFYLISSAAPETCE